MNNNAEIKALSKIEHENIIQFYEYFYADKCINIVVEFCEV